MLSFLDFWLFLFFSFGPSPLSLSVVPKTGYSTLVEALYVLSRVEVLLHVSYIRDSCLYIPVWCLLSSRYDIADSYCFWFTERKRKKKKKKERKHTHTHTPQPLNLLLLSEFHTLTVLFLFNCGAFYMSPWNFILYFRLLIKFVDIILFIVLSSKMHAASPNLVLYVNLRIVFFIPKS